MESHSVRVLLPKREEVPFDKLKRDYFRVIAAQKELESAKAALKTTCEECRTEYDLEIHYDPFRELIEPPV